MTHYTRILLMTVAAGAALKADPFIAMGDNINLFLTGTVAVAYDDNVNYLPADEVDDFIINVVPGVEAAWGAFGINRGSLYVQERFERYFDEDQYDKDLFSAGVQDVYDNGKTRVTVDVSFAQTAQNTFDIRDHIERETVRASGEMEVAFTEKISASAGAGVTNIDYQEQSNSVQYTDSEVYTFPVNIYYELTPKTDLSLGYIYRESNLDDAASTDIRDNNFNVGARGQFTQKFGGQVRMGYTDRSVESGDSTSQFTATASLVYAQSVKIVHTLSATKDFGTSGINGYSVDDMIFSYGLKLTFAPQWATVVSLNYHDREQIMVVDPREDKFFDGSIGVTYTTNYVVYQLMYSYRDNNCNDDQQDFEQNYISASATIRY